jgi:hypothetical protein
MRYETDLQDNEVRKVYGARGMNSKKFTRTFKNWAAMNRWLEGDGADCEIYSIERA